MAKKISREKRSAKTPASASAAAKHPRVSSPASVATAPALTPLPRRGWQPVRIAIACAALASVAFFAWWYVRTTAPERVLATLPALPDLTGKPAIQAELFAKATALARSPGRALEGVAELGRLHHANGYLREAEKCWRILRAEQPREPRWSYYLADLRRTSGDQAEFAALLAETVALAPDYSPAWLQLAGLEFKTGRTDLAATHYARRLTLVPGDPYARLGLARVAQQNSRTDEARRLVAELVRDVPQFSTGHNLLAEMLAAAGDAEGARRHRWLGRETGRFRETEDPWLEALQAWCHDYGRLCLLATIAQQTERGDRGKNLLERAIRLAPDHPPAYELLGGVHRKLGDAAKARDTFEEGLRVAKAASPSPAHYIALSETYGELKQPAEALRVAQLGLAQAGDEVELHDAHGVALAELNRHEEAVAAFRAALARNANDSNSNYNLGLSLLALGRTDEAHAAIKRSLILQPTFLKALSLLGRWELQAGRLAAAGEYLRPLYESHPEIPEVRQMLAQWHLRSGALAEKKNDPPTAEKHYRAGLAADPAQAELHASLGVLCLVQDRVEEARPALEAYHRLQPADPQSSLFLGQAYLRLGRVDEARRILAEGEQLARRAGNATTAAHFREILRSL